MKCPKCLSGNIVKSDYMNGNQRYKCNCCGCNYTVDHAKVSAKEIKMRFALSLYFEGLGFHSIGRLLHVSHVTVMNWIKKFGLAQSSIRNSKSVRFMELDEMHSYAGSKKIIFSNSIQIYQFQEIIYYVCNVTNAQNIYPFHIYSKVINLRNSQ